ncbi:hypothetical protein ACG7TL_002523 [Trametes sanguinea]
MLDDDDEDSVPAPLEGEKGPGASNLRERASDVSQELSPGGALPPIQPSAEKTEKQAPGRWQLCMVKCIDDKTYRETGEKVPLHEALVALTLSLVGTKSVHKPCNLREAQAQPEWPEWSCVMD